MRRKEIIDLAVERNYANKDGEIYTREQIERFRGKRWDDLVAWLGVEYTPAERSTSSSKAAGLYIPKAAGLYIPMEIINELEIIPIIDSACEKIAAEIEEGMKDVKPYYDSESGQIICNLPQSVKDLQLKAREYKKLLDRIKAVQDNA